MYILYTYGVPSPPKIKVDHNIQLDSLTINLANINIIFHSSTLYCNHWNFGHQLSKWQFSVQLYPSTFMLTCQKWSWHMGYHRKMKFESPSRMLSCQRRINPAKIQLENSTFKLIIQHVSISVFSNEHCCCWLRKYCMFTMT